MPPHLRLLAFATAAVIAAPLPALAVTVTVVGPDGEQVGGYRYLIEEDDTLPVSPDRDESRLVRRDPRALSRVACRYRRSAARGRPGQGAESARRPAADS
ncbi:MAG: hypothetical protein QM765_02555 [Myxococcales bacterium]